MQYIVLDINKVFKVVMVKQVYEKDNHEGLENWAGTDANNHTKEVRHSTGRLCFCQKGVMMFKQNQILMDSNPEVKATDGLITPGLNPSLIHSQACKCCGFASYNSAICYESCPNQEIRFMPGFLPLSRIDPRSITSPLLPGLDIIILDRCGQMKLCEVDEHV